MRLLHPYWSRRVLTTSVLTATARPRIQPVDALPPPPPSRVDTGDTTPVAWAGPSAQYGFQRDGLPRRALATRGAAARLLGTKPGSVLGPIRLPLPLEAPHPRALAIQDSDQ